MYCFGAEKQNELKKFLQERHIHDGYFVHATYNHLVKQFVVRIENRVWNDSLEMAFLNVCKFVSVADYKWGDNETVNCFVVIDESEKLPEFEDIYNRKNQLCFVWEMFSGNRIFIACSTMQIRKS